MKTKPYPQTFWVRYIAAGVTSGALLLGACSPGVAVNTRPVESIAVSDVSKRGGIASRAASQDEVRRADRFASEIARIDQLYPAPEMPASDDLRFLMSIDDDGVLTLSDGQRLHLAGLDCGRALKEGIMGTETLPIAVRVFLAAEKARSLPDGFVWIAKTLTLGDEQYRKAVRYQAINDSAALNGWCPPAGGGPLARRSRELRALRVP